jgi:hypothetical protein
MYRRFYILLVLSCRRLRAVEGNVSSSLRAEHCASLLDGLQEAKFGDVVLSPGNHLSHRYSTGYLLVNFFTYLYLLTVLPCDYIH